MNLINLHHAVAAVAPITGVVVGMETNKSTWQIHFSPEATEVQKTAAQAIIDNYDDAAEVRAAALASTRFTKLQIRRAMRELGIESTLDGLLSGNATFRADWSDAQEIDLADPLTVQALAAVSVDVNAVKLHIAGVEA